MIIPSENSNVEVLKGFAERRRQKKMLDRSQESSSNSSTATCDVQ